ncbi:ATP-binding cassette domain-containing protein [Pseudomonas sp. JDS28PS106]|uniref:ATP-binding cassette domain-containing protein n=1 Tax=Pseudomonas sp. JDS28PS106 TaxID=2497235 RepID=UPI002FD2BAAF
MNSQLSLQALRIAHGSRMLVDSVDLTLDAGRISALVGSSGSGKSLTCLGMLDLLPDSVRRVSGALSIDGRVVSPRQVRGTEVALILQNPRSAFNPVRSMRQHTMETLKVRGIKGSEARDRTDHALRAVGFEEPERLLEAYAFQLSGGMLQRMMIALALLAESRFLLADEPTSDLDVVAQARLLELLERLAAERQLGVLLVTHDMGVVARCCDHVSVMEHGRVIEQCEVRQLFEAPQSAAARALLHAHRTLSGGRAWR